jgi:hypothetical protein
MLFTSLLTPFGGNVHAAPVTLQFDAVVGPPRQGTIGALPPGWNTSLQQGDTVSGSFTFEPIDAPANSSKTDTVAPFGFSFQIKSRTLTTSQFSVEVGNDVFAIDADAPYDHISLGCTPSGFRVACIPANVAPEEEMKWAFSIALYGKASVLDGADVPGDPLTWQQFVGDNTMLVSYMDPALGWSYGFLATVRNFRVVPEPNTCVSLALPAALFLWSRSVLARKRC